MSVAMPYLRSLRKSDLVALAEVADLKEYVAHHPWSILQSR
jgi:hypothetical protein